MADNNDHGARDPRVVPGSSTWIWSGVIAALLGSGSSGFLALSRTDESAALAVRDERIAGNRRDIGRNLELIKGLPPEYLIQRVDRVEAELAEAQRQHDAEIKRLMAEIRKLEGRQ